MPIGNFFRFPPQKMGFLKDFVCKKDYHIGNPVAGRETEDIFKKSCVWLKDRQRTNCKTVTCVSERRVN